MSPALNDTTRPLRVGVCGFFIECNRWAPPSTAESFLAGMDLAGDALQAELQAKQPRTLPDTAGFVAAMNRLGPWEPVALRLAAAQPGGPVLHSYFESVAHDIEARLLAAGPPDAVFISSHGAALTTECDDPDGALFERIRDLVGPKVPVIAVLDLHTNVSKRMTDALSGFVAYRTNPHTDLRERGEEAAQLLHTLLAHGPGVVELVKLPLVPPATTQLVTPGSPYADLIELGQSRVGGPILNVSLCGGFALADCGKCGFSVVVSAQNGNRVAARALATEVAQAVWQQRHRFVSPLTPLPGAVRAAVLAGRPGGQPLILADVADNPGGGGGGNTITLLLALLGAGAQGVLLGVFTDAALASEAHALGMGAQFAAQFNRNSPDEVFAPALTHPARVLALSDGNFVGRRGMVSGSQQTMGPSALLDLGGVRVAVISQRQQLIDPAQLDVLGVDLATVRTLVVKSRGHFRAAFEGFVPPDRILEVDCPGLTTPNLAALAWTRLPRPIFPLDPHLTWNP